MKKLFSLLALIPLLACGNVSDPGRSLMVSENQKYLAYPDGTPFLWIGDTAWELFHRLNREEATEYLENRVEKGINIIQAVILAERDGIRVPNSYGNLPLIDQDPAQPNEAYFEHVDFIVNKAEELGLFVGILPTWGDKIYSINPGYGPLIFKEENARTFGEFLGKRYKDKPVVWILGGDRNIANMEVLQIWRAMAEGIESGDGGRNLISYHPRGASSSSYYLHNEPWLDFNMYQSGHEKKYNDLEKYTEYNALLQPRKPYLDAEPAYEDIAVQFWNYMNFNKDEGDRVSGEILDKNGIIIQPEHFEMGFFTDADVRVHGYWNFLSGACGYTYGNNAIWQMFKKGESYAIPALTDWREAMDRPGADDLRHMRKIFEARSFHKLLPDQSIVYGPKRYAEQYIRSAVSEDKSFMLVYLSVGQSCMVDLRKMNNEVNASWYNTRDGSLKEIGRFDNSGLIEFSPPTSGRGNDWLLVLDDASIDLPEI